MALQSKMTVYVAVAGVLVLMGGIVYYASLDNVELEQVEIKLTNVELRDINTIDNQAKFDVTFLITNPSDKAFTVAIIDYEIYGDEIAIRFRTILYCRYCITWKSSLLSWCGSSFKKYICSK